MRMTRTIRQYLVILRGNQDSMLTLNRRRARFHFIASAKLTHQAMNIFTLSVCRVTPAAAAVGSWTQPPASLTLVPAFRSTFTTTHRHLAPFRFTSIVTTMALLICSRYNLTKPDG